MLHSYLIIDSTGLVLKQIESSQFVEDYLCLGVYSKYETALNGILEHKPQLLLFHFNELISLQLLLDLHQYLKELPYVIALNENKTEAYSALKLGVSDYLLFPIIPIELYKSFLKFSKLNHRNSETKLCIKSNGDYHFISLDDIVYLKADNNTTDFYLQNGKKISGFKTMKFFENQLPFYFFRIHHSYVVNIHFVSRINLGKNVCYLLDNEYKIPFSRGYKENIDTIIRRIQ
ncbi:LytR/AlgR family response regulator transcription factor [Flavobacterium sp.]|uniref:LytR/AlgR family response regulator transcription factor n=1 Tax=Flavobacterium sp. TaxID=239 RepID=UPI0040481C32